MSTDGYVTAPDPATVAVVYTDDGAEFDRAWTWETGQTYANDGYRVVAVTGDGHFTREQCQNLYDSERAAALDCFGPEHSK